MILVIAYAVAFCVGITRTCGGDPKYMFYLFLLKEYYPHMRG